MNEQSQSGTREQNGPRVTGEQMRDVDRLRRSTSDRYIAGVAGGLGRHFDVDPTVVRVLLVVLTFFGGAGAVIYGAVWLFVPEDGQGSAPVEVTPDVRRIVLVVAAAVALMIVFGTPFLGDSWGIGFPFPLLVIGVIALVLYLTRDQWRSSSDSFRPPPPWGSTPPPASSPPQEGTSMSTTDTPPPPGTHPGTPADTHPGQRPPAWMPPPGPAYVPPPRPRRTGLVLFWPTLALIAIGLGTLGILDASWSIPVSAYAALSVAIVGAMLLVGAFVARPGGLIALGLGATLALVVTSLAGAATDENFSDERVFASPVSASEVRADYGISTGELTVDLSDVRDLEALDGRQIDVHLNAGELRVILPSGLNARVDAEIAYAGEIEVGDTVRGGFNQSLERTLTSSTAPGTPTIDLEVDVRVGQITVEQN